jgi:hypothetical protein
VLLAIHSPGPCEGVQAACTVKRPRLPPSGLVRPRLPCQHMVAIPGWGPQVDPRLSAVAVVVVVDKVLVQVRVRCLPTVNAPRAHRQHLDMYMQSRTDCKLPA